ncbi:MAG TPA: helix-turn-helix domain-containing protein [Gemmatimonadaceae bacterium]|jgi:DNA-binding transcriptional ArsR family regulator
MSPSRSFAIEIAVTPRFDVFYALHAIFHGGATPLEKWKERAVARLPRDFERSARRIAPVPLFWPLLADALQRTAGEMMFDEIVGALREISAEDLKANIVSGIFHDASTARALGTGRKNLRQVLTDEKLQGGELLTHFGLRPYDANSHATKAMSTLLSDPETFREQFVQVLDRFWETGFGTDWSALESSIRDESFRVRDLQDDGQSIEELSRDLALPVTFDASAREIRPKSGPPIAYDKIDRCFVIPSGFNTRRWWAKYETTTGHFSIYFPVTRDSIDPNRLAREVRAPSVRRAQSAINAETVFRALGDTTRYAIASILARTPTTSSDLARSIKVSKPTITHHVQALRAAGLIADTPRDGSTKLSLNRDTIRGVSEAAMEQLFSSTGSLSLDTTRKRRNT